MADVAARREARRRRILENSEYRLQRITGHVNHNESQDERNKKATEIEAQPITSSSNPNGILASEALMENQTVDSLIDELNADIEVEDSTRKSLYANEHDIFTLLSTSNVPHRRGTARSNSSENGNPESIKLNNSNNVRFTSDRHFDSHPAAALENSDRDISNANNIPETTVLSGILSSRLVYVILAIVVNIVVTLKLEYLFGRSIIFPFFVVMIGRLCVCKNNETAQGNNMLVAALILSNVRPDFVKIIHRLKGSFSLFSKIFRDFAVYIFTFVLLHNVLYRYWNDLDDILAFQKKPEAIYNDNASI